MCAMLWLLTPSQLHSTQSKERLLKVKPVPRYYFDLTNGNITYRDEVGVTAKNLEEATSEAQDVLKDMYAGDELMDVDDWIINIRDKNNKVLSQIPLTVSVNKSISH